MASGSQVMSGNWALLPTMPPKIRRAARVRSPGYMRAATPGLFSSRIFQVPQVKEHQEKSEEKGNVAETGHHKGLLARLGGAEFLIPEADQEIGRKPDQFPEDIELEHGRGDASG